MLVKEGASTSKSDFRLVLQTSLSPWLGHGATTLSWSVFLTAAAAHRPRTASMAVHTTPIARMAAPWATMRSPTSLTRTRREPRNSRIYAATSTGSLGRRILLPTFSTATKNLVQMSGHRLQSPRHQGASFACMSGKKPPLRDREQCRLPDKAVLLYDCLRGDH